MARMTRDEALVFLREGIRTGKLATSIGDEPHVAPVWFVVDGDELVFMTGATTVKARHLRENPRAALTVDDEMFPFSFVAVRGTVSLDDNPVDFLNWSTRIAARYVPAGRAAEYGARNAVAGELLCRLRIERLLGERDVAD